MRMILVPAVALAMSVSSLALAQGQQSGGQQSSQGGSQNAQQQNPTRNYEQSQQGGGQQSGTQQSQSQQNSGQQSAQSSQQSGSQQSGSQQASARSFKAVEDALKQAGIQNVQTLNAAYLVNATTQDGEQVSFVVDPPAAAASAQQGASSGQQGGSAGQQMALRSQQQVIDDLKKAGFSNVQIVEAAYLATGQTKSNDQITMMIDPGAEAAGQTATSER